MGLAINVLTGVMIFISIILVLVILMQEDKNGGGIGMIGGSSQSFFGASSAGFLTKVTTVLLVIFFVLSIVIGSFSAKSTKDTTLGNLLVSELEFEDGTKQVAEDKNSIKEAPESIRAEAFDKDILAKIADENVKKEIMGYYTKDSSGVYYKINKEGSAKKERIVEILNSVAYTVEAQTTVIGQ